MPALSASGQASTVAAERWRTGPGIPATARARTHNTAHERRSVMPEGYCVKERKKVEIQNPVQVTMKNGRPAIQGTCPDCGTKIFKIGKLN
jgi:hypothetical protein